MLGRRMLTALGLGACGVLMFAGTANAAVAGSANLGSASVTVDGDSSGIDPIAACDVTKPGTVRSEGESLDDVVSYGEGESSCGYDGQHKRSTMSAKGGDFRLDALREYGGPTIGFSSYEAGCNGTSDRSSAKFSVSGYYGVDLPEQIPANYTVTVPGADKGDPPMAKLTFGEIVPPQQQDGSVRLNTLHVKLFPQGGPESGDIYVGSAYCTLTR